MAQQSAAVENLDPTPKARAMGPIDRVHLAQQCLGDENLEYEILRLFDTTIDTYFGRLERAEGAAELAQTLHAIKGAASGVGAWTIADLAKAAETELQAGSQIAPECIADLGLAVEEVRVFIARMLADAPE
jgi:HPt (histidine-containing phosphotransfer) domain-containing protein